MKKLFAIILSASALLTGCGAEAPEEKQPPIDEKIYETFVFDESVIVSREKRETGHEGFVAVSGGENPARWVYIDEFDDRDRLVRATCYTDESQTRIRETEEYVYTDRGHYIKSTMPGDDKMESVQFRFYSRDGLYTDVYNFTHLIADGFYGLNFRYKTVKSADGKTTDQTFYTNTGEEESRTVYEKNDEGVIVKATIYEKGRIKQVDELDWDKSESKTTVYKDGQPDYVKVTNDGGNSYKYFDLDGNPID